MTTEIRLPQWAMGLTEGEVAHWLKKAGDHVEAGETIAEIEEAKITNVISSPVAGYVLQILVEEGVSVPVLTTLCLIGTQEELQVQTEQPINVTLPNTSPTVSQPTSLEANKERLGATVEVTPVARKLAKELNVDLTSITGSGPGGRITEADVRQAIEKVPATQQTEIRMSGMREVVAKRMATSLRDSAQLTLTMQADVTDLLFQRNELNAGLSGKVSITDVVVKAVALTLISHPRLNGWVDNEKISLQPEIHIGIAVALEEGLIAPVLKNVERKSLQEIAEETKLLAQKARDNTLGISEISGSTFTLTNLGMYGIDFFTPIINLPEIAILGVGAVKDTPFRKGNDTLWRECLPLSLTIDHRAVDGAPAAMFLRDLTDQLEHIDLRSL